MLHRLGASGRECVLICSPLSVSRVSRDANTFQPMRSGEFSGPVHGSRRGRRDFGEVSNKRHRKGKLFFWFLVHVRDQASVKGAFAGGFQGSEDGEEVECGRLFAGRSNWDDVLRIGFVHGR